MNRKTTIIISITGIIVIILALLGVTYGYYFTQVFGNEKEKSVEITTGDAIVKFTDLSQDDEMISLGLGESFTKYFTVENTGKGSANYYIFLVDVINRFERTEDVRYTLYRIGGNSEFSENYTNCVKKIDDIYNENCVIVQDGQYPIEISIISPKEVLPSTGNKYKYALVVTYINQPTENQDIDKGKVISGKVQVSGSENLEEYVITNPYVEGTLAYNIIQNAINKTNGTELMSKPLTTPAEQISSVTSYKTTGEEASVTESMSYVSNYVNKTWYYYDKYVVDATTGKFTLSGKHSCTYNLTTTNTDGETVNCYDDMKNKYLYSKDASENSKANNHTVSTKTNLSNVYKVMDVTASTLSYVWVFNSPNEAERVLALTTDDYGTSYYYRGDVEDNYVNFAGMCWRIVRIAGDGAIKLILEDQYTTCDDTETETTTAIYTGNWNIGIGKYGYDSSQSTSGATINKMSYLKPVTDVSNSMVKAFYDFQKTKLIDYTSNLKAGDWCLGDKAYIRSGSSGSYIYALLEDASNNYLSKSSFYYDAYTRLISENANGYRPTLKCNGTILDNFENVTSGETTITSETPMYVSAITADEIVYAGGKYHETNYNYYLMNDYRKDWYSFWSLSPDYFIGYVTEKGFYYGKDSAFIVSYSGSLREGNVDSNYVADVGYVAFRPAVSLASDVNVTGGEGTIEKPYIIG